MYFNVFLGCLLHRINSKEMKGGRRRASGRCFLKIDRQAKYFSPAPLPFCVSHVTVKERLFISIGRGKVRVSCLSFPQNHHHEGVMTRKSVQGERVNTTSERHEKEEEEKISCSEEQYK
jgi:hypothetical protein